MGMRFWKSRRKQGVIAASDLDAERIPRHIAIIMDGNGRWAQRRGMPRVFGHRAGAEVLREIVRTSSDLGVKALTVYAFSTENWKRPVAEVDFLMDLIGEYLENTVSEMHEHQVRIRLVGDMSGLNGRLQAKLLSAMQTTQANCGLTLNLAINYGGRAEILHAVQQLARKVQSGELLPEQISEELFAAQLYTADQADPDLLIRPGGDHRISNFLLWQLAYTEFWFTDACWPDFTPQTIMKAIYDYQQRDRRFGGLKNT